MRVRTDFQSMHCRPLVSVVTAALNPVDAYLIDAYDDLCAQAPSWEWLIQLDGELAPLPARLDADSRVSVGANGRWLGTAVSRNRALARANGKYVYAHDYDDRLAPGAFAALLAPLQRDRTLAWSAGQFDDLVLRDGRWERKPFPYSCASGRVAAGAWESDRLRHWDEGTDAQLPAANCLMWRADWLYALGGWGALTGDQDTFAAWALQHLADGHMVEDQVGWHRKHDRQTTASPGFREEAQLHHELVVRRLRALELLGWRSRLNR
jgi:glycosyltransferase involved in cell wall biosynthesis